MIWDGLTVLILYGFRPRTEVAIEWHQRADGNWRGSDRTITEDVFLADVTFQGPEDELTDLQTTLNKKRTEFTAEFNTTEEIFGADVDHSTAMKIVVTRYGKIRQVSFDVFEMNLTVRNIVTTFKPVTADISQLRTASHSDERETAFEINKKFTYDGEGFASDRLSADLTEPGTFRALFSQDQQEMPAIRRYLLTTARANKVGFPDFGGITEPFGPRAGTGPFECRIIDWEDTGRSGFCEWGLSITFARELNSWNS